MSDRADHDTRLIEAQRFKDIAARKRLGLARSGMLAAARHLEQEVLERPTSTLTVQG